jgi:hypothetical protein
MKAKAPQQLPKPIASGSLVPIARGDLEDAREEAAEFETNLAALHGLVFRHGRELWDREITEEDISLVRRISPEIDSMRRRWHDLTRPTTAEDIAIEVLMLTTTMPSAGNVNQNSLNALLCGDVKELKPSRFALMRGCHAVRTKYRFLNEADLIAKIKKAELNARRYTHAFEQFDLADFNKELQEQIEDRKARVLEREAERKCGRRQEKLQKLSRTWMKHSKCDLVPGGPPDEDDDGAE